MRVWKENEECEKKFWETMEKLPKELDLTKYM